jgi:peroxin-6
MDELDSIAPKRGNQGDSGGVMDRIVSQLLAELDGMSSGGDNTQVYVLGATNRPDLLDPALLRPGRFDRMLYLSVATTDAEQLSILQALTRKFNLDPDLDLDEISKMCSFNYTGADFYALCSDAMLKAMTRAADKVDAKVEQLNRDSGGLQFPKPLTVQYYLASLATKEDIDVKVGQEDFVKALEGMKPSVSESEMKHYERVQQEFKGFSIRENK